MLGNFYVGDFLPCTKFRSTHCCHLLLRLLHFDSFKQPDGRFCRNEFHFRFCPSLLVSKEKKKQATWSKVSAIINQKSKRKSERNVQAWPLVLCSKLVPRTSGIYTNPAVGQS